MITTTTESTLFLVLQYLDTGKLQLFQPKRHGLWLPKCNIIYNCQKVCNSSKIGTHYNGLYYTDNILLIIIIKFVAVIMKILIYQLVWHLATNLKVPFSISQRNIKFSCVFHLAGWLNLCKWAPKIAPWAAKAQYLYSERLT